MPPPECPTWPRPPPRACCNFFRGSSLSSVFNFQVPARFLVRGASGAFAAEALCESCGAVPGNGPGGACAFVATVDENAAKRTAAPRVSRKMFVCKLATDCPSSEFPASSTKVPSRGLCLHSDVKRLSTKSAHGSRALAMAKTERFPAAVSGPAAVDRQRVAVNETAGLIFGKEQNGARDVIW